MPGTESSLNSPAGLALDSNNNLYIADWQNYLIRKVSFGATPVISPGGIVNAASFTPAIAPGSLISIFGANFIADTTVQVNGVSLPLLAVSSQQINAQLQFEVVPGTAALPVTNTLGVSAPVSFTVLPAAPGIFANAVLNRNGALNSPAIRWLATSNCIGPTAANTGA